MQVTHQDKNLLFFFLSISTLILSACSSYDHRLNSKSIKYLGSNDLITKRTSDISLDDRDSYWSGQSAGGPAKIVINITHQKLFYYKGDTLVGISPICTGGAGHDSPTGHFRIQSKDPTHASNHYGDFVDASGQIVVRDVTYHVNIPPPGTHFQGSSMPWFLQFAPAIGLHAGFLPGTPDSHGCIRLPEKMAKIFYSATPIGTPVIIEK